MRNITEILSDVLSGSQEENMIKRFERTYDETLKNVGKSLWKGMLKVTASGFGKGLLLTAAVVAGGAMLAFGLAAAGGVTSFMGYNLAVNSLGVLATPVGHGMMVGLSAAGNFLLASGLGIAAMLAGGTLGAVTEARKHQGKITAEIARAQEAMYELEREKNRQLKIDAVKETARDPNYVAAAPDKNLAHDCSHCARLLAQREEANNIYRSV